MRIRALTLTAALLTSHTAFARFDGKQRSINGTGETLPQGGVEAGIVTAAIGIDDNLMVQIPTFPLLLGEFGVEARYKIPVSSTIRVSPEAGIGFSNTLSSFSTHVGGVVGFDLPGKRNCFDLGLTFARQNDYDFSDKDDWRNREHRMVNRVYMNGEYDHYTDGGNLFYIGVSRTVPYLGFTWAWENVHLGIISTPIAFFFPLPYIYLRF